MIKCQGCGCNLSDTADYCPVCGRTVTIEQDELLNGIPTSELNTLIDKRAGDFMPVFRKNEHKKFFLSLNLFAMLFGPLWYVYRKMYVEAILYYLLECILSVVIFLLLIFAFKTPIDNLRQECTSVNGNIQTFNREEFETEIAKISDKIYMLSYLLIIAARISLSFLSKFVYREHLVRNHGKIKGGVSVWPVVIVWFVNAVIVYFVQNSSQNSLPNVILLNVIKSILK